MSPAVSSVGVWCDCQSDTFVFASGPAKTPTCPGSNCDAALTIPGSGSAIVRPRRAHLKATNPCARFGQVSSARSSSRQRQSKDGPAHPSDAVTMRSMASQSKKSPTCVQRMVSLSRKIGADGTAVTDGCDAGAVREEQGFAERLEEMGPVLPVDSNGSPVCPWRHAGGWAAAQGRVSGLRTGAPLLRADSRVVGLLLGDVDNHLGPTPASQASGPQRLADCVTCLRPAAARRRSREDTAANLRTGSTSIA